MVNDGGLESCLLGSREAKETSLCGNDGFLRIGVLGPVSKSASGFKVG